MRGAKRGLLVAAMFAALVLAACGSSGSSSHSTTVASNGVAAKSPTEILNAAVAAAESARSMHVSGTVQQHGTIGLDLDLVTGKGAAGTISQGAPKFKLIVVGADFYFQGNRAFWLHAAHSQAAVQLLLGKWIRYPSAGAQFGSVSHLTSIKAVMDAIVKEHGTLEVRSPRTGALRHTFDVGAGHWNSPVVVGGRVILPTGSYHDDSATGTLVILHLPGR